MSSTDWTVVPFAMPPYFFRTRRIAAAGRAVKREFRYYETLFFAKHKLSCGEILQLGYPWLAGCGTSGIATITGHGSEPVVSFIGHYRRLVASALDANDTVICGPGVVEIDESKFGKRKYNRGHRVEGVWVIGGVERSDNRLMFAEVVEQRDAATLLDVISRHVAAGSIVHTDLWVV